MAVTQIATLVQFTTSSVNAVADLNANLASIRNQFNALVTANNTLISGLTIPSPTLTGAVTFSGAVTGITTLNTTGVVTVGQINPVNLGTFKILGGSTGLTIRNNADSADNIITTDAGNVTIRGTLAIAGALSGVTTLALSGAQSGGTTLSLAGPITLTAAASRIVPGATSFSLRDTGNANDNFIVTDAGNATLRGSLTFAAATSQIVPGATSLSLRNNANGADNFILTDAGNATLRGNLTFASATTKIAAPSAGDVQFRSAGDTFAVLRIQDTGAVTLGGGQLNLAAATTSIASLLMPSGTAPTSPADGQMWYDGTNLKFRNGGTTRTVTWV